MSSFAPLRLYARLNIRAFSDSLLTLGNEKLIFLKMFGPLQCHYKPHGELKNPFIVLKKSI